MKKIILLAMLICTIGCFASIEELSNAIKISDVNTIKTLSTTLHLTKSEHLALIDLTREIVEQRHMDIQIFNIQRPQVPSKKHQKSDLLGLIMHLGGFIGTFINPLFQDFYQPPTKAFIAQEITLITVAIGGLIVIMNNHLSAIKATAQDLNQQYMNSLDIRLLLLCWPLVKEG